MRRRRRSSASSAPVRRVPLPPDLRDEMKKALRAIYAQEQRRRGEIAKTCREAVAAAKAEKDRAVAELQDEYALRADSIRAGFDARAAARLLEKGESNG